MKKMLYTSLFLALFINLAAMNVSETDLEQLYCSLPSRAEIIEYLNQKSLSDFASKTCIAVRAENKTSSVREILTLVDDLLAGYTAGLSNSRDAQMAAGVIRQRRGDIVASLLQKHPYVIDALHNAQLLE